MNRKDNDTTRQKTAEILIVGNELLNGTTVDSNSQWLSEELCRFGVRLERKTTVRDELGAISKAFRDCISRKPDWLFSLGGLGPTYDDLTIQSLGIAIGKKLSLDDNSVAMLKESYNRRSRKLGRTTRRTLSKASLKMAMLPEDSTALQNPVGSAPGVLARFWPTTIVSLPGVPSEMKAIFDRNLVQMLRADSQFINAEEWIKVVGISESRLSAGISRITKKYAPLLYVKSHPMGFENGRLIVHIQIIMTSRNEETQHSLLSLEKATL
ncbi:MAG: molybdopterin-binding protein [Nitrososphaerales archaeon]